MAPLTPSPALADVIGNKGLPRTEIIKKIWDYIKKNKLQDTKNKRMINADAKLKVLFGGKSQISMFELAKVVSKHVK
ncbi:MAG TPA: SWIB/MDM2 domain-containing protein [Chitinophagaceae bacterium]|nr:SWIB/MDM2 domain-containing protein [Chitinophagaceae bacterium]